VSWPTVRLDEVARIVGGATPPTGVSKYWAGDINWATPKDLSNLSGPYLSETSRRITAAGLASCATELLPVGSVLFSSRAPIGHVAINTVPMATNQGFKSLVVDSQRADAGYLYWWLKSHRSFMEGLGNGATFKEVSKAVVSRVEIPLPPLDEQRRIAAILDQSDEVRLKQKASLDLIDCMRPAVFTEHFGDPVTNPRRWERVPFGDILDEIQGGWSPICLDRVAAEDEWGVLKLGAVTYGRYDGCANKALPPEQQPRPELEIQAGDILFSRKNTHDLVAASVLVHESRPRLMFPDLMFRIRIKPGSDLNPVYLQGLISFPTKRREIQKLASGAAGSMPNISKGRLQTVLIERPPLAQQEAFARAIGRVEELRAKVMRSLDQLNDLFSSVQHRAFCGEL